MNSGNAHKRRLWYFSKRVTLPRPGMLSKKYTEETYTKKKRTN